MQMKNLSFLKGDWYLKMVMHVKGTNLIIWL